MNLSPLQSTLRRLSPLSTRRSQGLDPSLLPYVPKVIEEEKQKQLGLQPLQLVLDLLQRGQYLTANIADEIQQSFTNGTPLSASTVNVLKAAFRGITGQRKGDWETLLFGGNIQGGGERAGWLPENLKTGSDEPLVRWGAEGSTGLAEGIFRPRKLIGLAANIAGDPLTYLTFGATKLAQATASRFADDVLRLTVATMGPEDFAKLGLSFSEKVGKNVENVMKVVKSGGNSIAKRSFEDIYNKAYINALRNPAEKIVSDVAPRLQLAAEKPGLQGLVQAISPANYPGAGQRGASFLGRQFGVGIRQPWAPTRAWDFIKNRLDAVPPGRGKLADAWYSVMNEGVVGQIKRAFGIRNPYEQMIHLKERGVAEIGLHTMAEQQSRMVAQTLGKYDEATIEAARNATVMAESQASQMGAYDILSRTGYKEVEARWTPAERQALEPLSASQKILDPQFQAALGIKPEQVDKVHALLNDIRTINKKWIDEENEIAQRVGADPVDDRLNYFPGTGVGGGELGEVPLSRGGRGPGGARVAKQKELTQEEHIQANAKTLQFLMGDQLQQAWERAGKTQTYDEFVRDFVVNHNLVDNTLDLWEAYRLRAIAHAKFMSKYSMIEQFRQFGVPIEDAAKAAPQLATQLTTWGQGASQVGLYKVAVPGFENYLFDETVARAITHAGTALASPEGTASLARAFNYFTTMWKGFVTLTPGFHIRNFISNNMTGFIKFGPRWFDLRKMFGPVSVGVAYALHPEKYVDLLTGALKVDTGWIAQQLNRRVGDFSVSELADYARATGIIGTRTQIAEEGLGQGATSLLPTSRSFVGFKYSKDIGDVIENTAKFQSFLMDYMDVAQRQINVTPVLEETRNVPNYRIPFEPNLELENTLRQFDLGTIAPSKAYEIADKYGLRRGNIDIYTKAKRRGYYERSDFYQHPMDEKYVSRTNPTIPTAAERLAQQKAFLEYAGNESKKWFLDYGDLTDFEQNRMRKIIPFYAWIRKNLANQLSGLVLYPETYSVIPKVRGALTSDEGFNYSLMPDYMKNVGYYPVGRTAAGTNIMRWANLPLEDLNKIPLLFNEGRLTGVQFTGQEILQDVMSNAHPLIKSFVEMVTGKDLYRRRDIKPFERAAPVFQYLTNSPGVIQFLDGAMRTAGFGNGLRIHVSPDGAEVQMDGKTARLLDSNLPALRTLDMLISTPEVLAEQVSPAVQTWIEKVTGKTDYYTGLQELFQVISRVGGWKFQEVNQDEQAKLKEAQLRARLSQMKSEEEKDRLADQIRYLKRKRTTETRNRAAFGKYTRQ